MGKKLLEDNASLREQVAYFQQQLQNTSLSAPVVEPVKDTRLEELLAERQGEMAVLQSKNASLHTQLEAGGLQGSTSLSHKARNQDALQANAGLMRDFKAKVASTEPPPLFDPDPAPLARACRRRRWLARCRQCAPTTSSRLMLAAEGPPPR